MNGWARVFQPSMKARILVLRPLTEVSTPGKWLGGQDAPDLAFLPAVASSSGAAVMARRLIRARSISRPQPKLVLGGADAGGAAREPVDADHLMGEPLTRLGRRRSVI